MDKQEIKSIRDDWETPQLLFDRLNAEFNLQIDAAADEKNKKCAYYLKSALIADWRREAQILGCRPNFYCNPPYSNPKHWVAKAVFESGQGATVVMLLPACTDVGWWHDFVLEADEIRFLRGRLKFEYQGKSAYPARMGSAVVIFRPQHGKVRNRCPAIKWVTYER